MKKVLLDTNFLLIPAQFGVDIFSEIDRVMDDAYELVTIDAVVDELDKLATQGTAGGKGADKKAAKVGRALLEVKKVRVLKTEKHLNADKLIVQQSKSPDFIVATQDQELKRLLKENNTKLIVLRGKNHLELI